MTNIRSTLLLLTLGTVVGVGAACSGGGDDDDANTPTPSPTAVTPDYCQIAWVNVVPGGDIQDGPFDIYLVDGPLDQWTSGTKNYAVNGLLGVFYNDATSASPGTIAYADAAVTTAGQFTLTLANGTTTGATVEHEDDTAQTFFALDNGQVGAEVGTGGTGDFSGTWSDPDATQVTPGSGLIAITWMNTSMQIGVQGSFAKCYDRTVSFESRTAGNLVHLAGAPHAP